MTSEEGSGGLGGERLALGPGLQAHPGAGGGLVGLDAGVGGAAQDAELAEAVVVADLAPHAQGHVAVLRDAGQGDGGHVGDDLGVLEDQLAVVEVDRDADDLAVAGAAAQDQRVPHVGGELDGLEVVVAVHHQLALPAQLVRVAHDELVELVGGDVGDLVGALAGLDQAAVAHEAVGGVHGEGAAQRLVAVVVVGVVLRGHEHDLPDADVALEQDHVGLAVGVLGPAVVVEHERGQDAVGVLDQRVLDAEVVLVVADGVDQLAVVGRARGDVGGVVEAVLLLVGGGQDVAVVDVDLGVAGDDEDVELDVVLVGGLGGVVTDVHDVAGVVALDADEGLDLALLADEADDGVVLVDLGGGHAGEAQQGQGGEDGKGQVHGFLEGK